MGDVMIRRQATLKKSEDTFGWKSLELVGQQISTEKVRTAIGEGHAKGPSTDVPDYVVVKRVVYGQYYPDTKVTPGMAAAEVDKLVWKQAHAGSKKDLDAKFLRQLDVYGFRALDLRDQYRMTDDDPGAVRTAGSAAAAGNDDDDDGGGSAAGEEGRQTKAAKQRQLIKMREEQRKRESELANMTSGISTLIAAETSPEQLDKKRKAEELQAELHTQLMSSLRTPVKDEGDQALDEVRVLRLPWHPAAFLLLTPPS